MAEEAPENDHNVEMWKIKKLIKNLQAARGCARLPRVTTAASLGRLTRAVALVGVVATARA
jgi:hypothetical protein